MSWAAIRRDIASSCPFFVGHHGGRRSEVWVTVSGLAPTCPHDNTKYGVMSAKLVLQTRDEGVMRRGGVTVAEVCGIMDGFQGSTTNRDRQRSRMMVLVTTRILGSQVGLELVSSSRRFPRSARARTGVRLRMPCRLTRRRASDGSSGTRGCRSDPRRRAVERRPWDPTRCSGQVHNWIETVSTRSRRHPRLDRGWRRARCSHLSACPPERPMLASGHRCVRG